MTQYLSPPSSGLRNSITFSGRTYSSTPGVAVAVPDFDASILQANGWTAVNSSLTQPPQVAAIPGLPKMLQNNGWQILTARPQNQAGSAMAWTPASLQSGSMLGVTSRSWQQALFSATHIILVYATFNQDNSLPESPGRNRVKIKAALEKLATGGPSSETGVRVPVTFNNGNEIGEIPPSGLLFSDPAPFDVFVGEQFFVRNYQIGGGPSTNICAQQFGGGGTFAGSFNNGDGVAADDAVLNGTVSQGQKALYMPCAILGFSPTPQKTVALMGDSIFAGTGDMGNYRQDGGWPQRILQGQTATALIGASVLALTPRAPFVKTARGGYTLIGFSNRLNSFKELRLAEFASTAINEYGTNDLTPSALANMKAAALATAAWFTARGIFYIQCTLLPKTSSTDNFQTVANQTQSSSESTRTGYNSWLRDTSASGFVAQAGGPSVAGVWDAAATVEVNSSGVLTPNGGFWPAAIETNSYSGTTASGTSTGQIVDSTGGFSSDQWRGYVARITGGAGAAAGAVDGIPASNATTLTLGVGITNLASGQTYTLFRPITVDGTHPSADGHNMIANGLVAAGAINLIR